MISNSTVQLRHKLAFGFMGLIAPKLRLEVETAYKRVCFDTPRPFTLMLKEKKNREGLIGAEIGFGCGYNAESIVNLLKPAKLFCIDPFFGSRVYLDSGLTVDWYSQLENNRLFKDRVAALKASGHVEFVKAFSDEAWSSLPKDLDFVYIDGNHSLDYAYRDIANGMQAVKVGGFVGGHDYFNASFEVAEAVFKYRRESGLEASFDFPDFWFQKGGLN
jgi:hypothetical protein